MLRAKLATLVANPLFERFIIAVIVVNAITLGLETSPWWMERFGPLLSFIDKACLAIFVAEIAARLTANFTGFWRDPWRIFDFTIVAIALMPATGALSVLRAFRILRVLRLISQFKAIRRVVTGLLSAIPGMGSIVILLGLIFYIFAVIATKLFAQTFPEWFGSIGESAYTLFQIMTLESWSMGIVRPVLEVYPYAWAFFVPFIMVTTFAVVNLIVGLVVNSMQDAHAEESNAATDAYRDEVLERLKAIEERLGRRD